MAGCNVGGNSNNAYGNNPQKGFVPSKWGTLDSPEKSPAGASSAPQGRGPVAGVKSFDVQAQPMFSSASNANQAVQGDKAEHTLPMVKRGPNSGELPASDESGVPVDAPAQEAGADAPADRPAEVIPSEPSKTSVGEKDSVHLISAELEAPAGGATEVSTVAIDGRKSSTADPSGRVSSSASGLGGKGDAEGGEEAPNSPSGPQETAARRQTSLVKKDPAPSDAAASKEGDEEEPARAPSSPSGEAAEGASGGEEEKGEPEGTAKVDEKERSVDAPVLGNGEASGEKEAACAKAAPEAAGGGGDEDELQEEVLSD